jgi:hypothetical protein
VSTGRGELQKRRRDAAALYAGGSRTTSGILTAAEGAMSAVGAVWGFIANDAAAEAAQMPSEAQRIAGATATDIHVTVIVSIKGKLYLPMCYDINSARMWPSFACDEDPHVHTCVQVYLWLSCMNTLDPRWRTSGRVHLAHSFCGQGQVTFGGQDRGMLCRYWPT